MASIQKRINKAGEVSYLVTVFLGFDEAGNKLRHHETVHGSKNDAKIVAGKLEEARRNGRVVTTHTTIAMLFDDLLRDYKLNGKDQDHLEEGRIRTNLRPWFDAIDANKLTTMQVNAYIDKRKTDGVTNSTINRELSLVRHALKMGMATDPPKVVRAPRIPKLKEGKARSGFLEYDEYRAMRDALPEHLKPILTIAFYTGMRKGEILKLRWEQVDLLECVIRLNPGETKNKDGRLLPLDGELLETIRMQRAIRDAKYPDCPWVFHWRGKRIHDFRGSWEVACKKAGLWDAARVRGKKVGGPTKLVHDLRRTGVRNLVRAGVPEKVAMAISGHKTRDVFERYNILDMRDLRSAMRNVSAYHEANAAKTSEQIPTGFQHEAPGTVRQ
jgi:integrase